MRRKARVDNNQRQIVAALRNHGASVLHLHQLGSGCPDILVGYRGRNFLVEIKDGSKPPSKQKLSKDEAVFFEGWNGQIAIINSIESAIALIEDGC